MKKISKSAVLFLALFCLSILPLLAFAQPYSDGLVPCDGVQVKCDFSKFMELISRLIKYMIYLAIPISSIALAYAGYLYLTAVGDPGKVKEARSIFGTIVTGFVIMLSAFLIVYTILEMLTGNTYTQFLRP